MTRSEFIDLHGEKAWKDLAARRQNEPDEVRAFIVHQHIITPILRLLGFDEGQGLLAATDVVARGLKTLKKNPRTKI